MTTQKIGQVLEMCIGIPMQVQSVTPGYAVCAGRGEQRRVNTALVGPLEVADWVLVFLNDARECITSERAIEVNLTLDMVQEAMNGQFEMPEFDDTLGFRLPSQMNAQDLHALTGDKK